MKEETTGDFIYRIVTPEWIKVKMLMTGIKQVDIIHDTGFSKTQVSPWINGKKPMSRIVKNFFYYYFSLNQS